MTESSATTKQNIHRVEFSLGCVRNACLVPGLSSSPFFVLDSDNACQNGTKKNGKKETLGTETAKARIPLRFCTAADVM